jgi:hypothetical protein
MEASAPIRESFGTIMLVFFDLSRTLTLSSQTAVPCLFSGLKRHPNIEFVIEHIFETYTNVQEVKSMYLFRDLEVKQQTFRLRTPETCGVSLFVATSEVAQSVIDQ